MDGLKEEILAAIEGLNFVFFREKNQTQTLFYRLNRRAKFVVEVHTTERGIKSQHNGEFVLDLGRVEADSLEWDGNDDETVEWDACNDYISANLDQWTEQVKQWAEGPIK